MLPDANAWTALTLAQSPTSFTLSPLNLTAGYYCVVSRVTGYANVLSLASNTLNVATVPLGGTIVVDTTAPAAGALRHCPASQFPCSNVTASRFTCAQQPHCFRFSWDTVTLGISGLYNATLTATLQNTSSTATVLSKSVIADVSVTQVQQCLPANVVLPTGSVVFGVLNITNNALVTTSYRVNVTLDLTPPTGPNATAPITTGATGSPSGARSERKCVCVWGGGGVGRGSRLA